MKLPAAPVTRTRTGSFAICSRSENIVGIKENWDRDLSVYKRERERWLQGMREAGLVYLLVMMSSVMPRHLIISNVEITVYRIIIMMGRFFH